MTPERFAPLCNILNLPTSPPSVEVAPGVFAIRAPYAGGWCGEGIVEARGTSHADALLDYQRHVLLTVAGMLPVLRNHVALTRAFALAGDAAVAAADAELAAAP